MSRRQLSRIEALLTRLDAALVVREPGNARAAEAYDGLRKQVNQSSKNRRAHVAHLLSLSDSIGRGADFELLSRRVEEFLLELGVRRTDTLDADWYEIEGGSGPWLEVVEPAVIETTDDGTISVVRLGKARRSAVGEGVSAPTAETQVADFGEPKRPRGLAVSVGLAVLVVGFFLGWTVASISLDGAASSSGVATQAVENGDML